MRRRLVSWFLVVSVVMSLFAAFPMNAFAFNKDTMNSLCPIYAYPQDWDDDGYFPTYTTNECTTKAGKIYKSDYCTITNFYYKNDKWVVKVTYPVSGGTKTAYAKAIRFFPDCYSDFEPYKRTAAAKTYVSKTAGASTESGWYISSGDKFYVITRDSNGNAQVVYPLSGGGYKMGWIKHYDVKYNANGGSGAPSTQHKIQNVNLTLSDSKPSRTGYTFNSWNTSKDGSGTKYSSGATYTGNKAITLYAQWKVIPYTLTVTSANTSMGTVSGGGTYNYGTSVTITASPKTGYRFVKWSDGSTSASKTVKVTGNASYTAYFEAISYTLTAKSNDTSLGTVSGGSTYNYGTSVTLTASPKTGCKFVKWSDNVTTNPRTVKVTGNTTYTAYFEKNNYTVSVVLRDISTDTVNNSLGTVTGTGTYPYGTYITLKVTPNSGNGFVEWDDDENASATRTIQVTGNYTYTAYLADDDTCPHVFGNYVIDTDSTCSKQGSKHRNCTLCGYLETDIIPLKNHSLGDWIVDSEPTCEKLGSKHKVCTVCGQVMPSEDIEVLGHDTEETIVEPTCTVKGTKTLTCKRDGCGYTTTEEIRYPGHNYQLSESTKEGYATLICTACDDVIEKKLYAFGEDTYSFYNRPDVFARKTKVLLGETEPYFDIKTFYAVFANQYDDSNREHVIQPIYYENKIWKGVCFGMSASSLLFYNNNLNLEDYSDATNVHNIGEPQDYINKDAVKGPMMVQLRSMIEFFQISQHRDEVITEYHANRSGDEYGWAKLNDLVVAVKRFVETGENGVIIRVQGESGQHAIVPVSYNESPSDCAFEIGIYDNSAPDEVYPLKLYKDDSGAYNRFRYQGDRYTQLISYNMVDTVFDLMVGTMVGDEGNDTDITEILSYARIYTNSNDVTITNSDGVDISTLNEAYRIVIADSDDDSVNYLVPYGDYIVQNNNEEIEEFEVSIIGPKDTKIVSSKDNQSTVHVGIHTEKKSTYVKAKKSNSNASLFSTDSDTTSMTVTNISSDGIRDLIEVDAEYVVLDTSNGTLDIASDVNSVKLNGDTVTMTTVDVEDDTSSDTEVSVETSSGILVSMGHIGSIVKAPSSSTEDDDSENITSCQIGAQNIGYSTDAINNSEYNYTVSIKSNELTNADGVVSGDVEFNIYNNSESSSFAYVLFSAYKNDGTFIGEYFHECMLGVNNNYVKVEDVYIEVPTNCEFYVMASVIDVDDIQLSDEVELILPNEPDYSLRVISDNLVLEENVIRGDVQIDVHTKDTISGTCKAYLCFYSEQGRLLGLYTKDVTIDSIDTPIPFTEISIPCEDGKWSAKCLLWSGDDTLIPLSTPVELVIEEAE